MRADDGTRHWVLGTSANGKGRGLPATYCYWVGDFDGARSTTIDGLRADWQDGWGLVRASNTTPVLVLRFEADDAAALARIKDLYRGQLARLLPDTPLEF